MHLMVSITSPRSGFHMLHSMLAADPQVLDAGCTFMGETAYPSKGNKYGIPAYIEIAQDNPHKIVFGNVKWLERVKGAEDATFIHLYRKSLVAHHASQRIAQIYNCWYAPPTVPVQITLDKTLLDEWARLTRKEFARVRSMLAGMKYLEIAYEDLTRQSLSAALEGIGAHLTVGDPTTPKIAPPFEECVTNWHDFDPSLYGMDHGAADK
jgi:hypothetical protein